MPTRMLLLCLSTVFFARSLFGGGEVLSHYSFEGTNENILKKVADRFEIIGRDGKTFQVLVPIESAKEFLALAPNAVLVERDIHEFFENLKNDKTWLENYRSFDEVIKTLKRIENDHPKLSKLYQYGTSADGHPLYALKVSDEVELDENEPEVMLTAATHGDEIITVEVLLGLLEQMVAEYGKNNRLTELVNTREIYFIPVVNPEGFTRRSRYESGADPNRSFPWPESSGSPTPSIKALIDFFHSHHFMGTIDFHAYGQLIMFPWAYTTDAPEDEARYIEITKGMAEKNNYGYGQISRILYVAKGSSADYFYWKNRSISLGIEVATSKAPHSSQIMSHVNANTESTWHFIESIT